MKTPDDVIGGGGDDDGVGDDTRARRKCSRANSIVFETVPEIFVESSDGDDSSLGFRPSSSRFNFSSDSLNDDNNNNMGRTPKPEPLRTQPTKRPPSLSFLSVVKGLVRNMSSLGLNSTSEVPVNTSPSIASITATRAKKKRSGSVLSAQTMLSVEQPTEKYCLSDRKINLLRSIIGSSVWKGTSAFSVFVMLFGAPIQDLFLPMSWDVAVDVVFTIAFVTLIIDILILCIVDKAYFACDRVGSSLTPQETCKWCNLHAASFMFWCDLVGTLSFIYDIPWMNPEKKRLMLAHLTLKDGVLIDEQISAAYVTRLGSIDWEILVIVGRVARLARPIRSYVLFEGMHSRDPSFWLRKLSALQNYRMKSGRNNRSLNHSSERVLVGSGASYPAGDVFSIDDSLDFRRNSSMKKSMGRVNEEQDSSSEEKRCSCFPLCVMNCKDNFIPREIRRKGSLADAAKSEDENGTEMRERTYFGGSRDCRSHVGTVMQQLTGQRVALGVFVAFLMGVLCNWQRIDRTSFLAMAVLHGQTQNAMFAKQAVDTARESVIPGLLIYSSGGHILLNESLPADLRPRDLLNITVRSQNSEIITMGIFDYESHVEQAALVEILLTLFVIIVWIIGLLFFVGPVMILVVDPIERMIRLLDMLMRDPLGYATTKEFRIFMQEEDYFSENSLWGKDVLSGMETNFLMKTLLRIGSLMKVGFGSAGVEIIRNNLERGRNKDVLFLNKQGTTVSCIFLFCDIRQFTDATECLQEEVFVFTNKIAAVVHSICNSYGGTANKNIGDAFLVSWLLDDESTDRDEEEKQEEQDAFATYTSQEFFSSDSEHFRALNHQADKALLAVVKISIALHYDDFFVETMNEEARNRLLTKLSKRKGPIVQMGFGLHAGKAVQGAIGSQRKLDATYLSLAVERAEFLESNTKTYGVPLLMSDSFYNLLDSVNKYRCRKIDQLILLSGENDCLTDPREILDSGEKMSIYTFDMDIDALWRVPLTNEDDGYSSTSNSDIDTRRSSKLRSLKRRSAIRRLNVGGTEGSGNSLVKAKSRRFSMNIDNTIDEIEAPEIRKRALILPSGAANYSDKSWFEADIKTIRHDLVSNGVFFPKFDDGLKSYYAKDWEHAKKCFETVLSQRDDGPSRYFIKCMEKYGGKPPKDFLGYGLA